MSGTLPIWLEHWFGINAGPGEGVAWRLEGHWPWPPWVTLLTAILAVVVVAAIYHRESRTAGGRYRAALAVMRLTSIAIVLLMIAQLAIVFERTGRPCVAVLVDDSLSMTIVDRYEPQVRMALESRVASAGGGALSRWNLAKTLLTEHDAAVLSAIAKGYKLQVYFLSGVRPSTRFDVAGIAEELNSMQPAGESSRLGAAVRGVLDDFRARRRPRW